MKKKGNKIRNQRPYAETDPKLQNFIVVGALINQRLKEKHYVKITSVNLKIFRSKW